MSNLDDTERELIRDLVRQYRDGVESGDVSGFGEPRDEHLAWVDALAAKLED